LVADLQPGDFWNEQNRAMWLAIQHLSARGELVTVITLAHELATRGALDDVLDEVLIQTIVGNWFTAIGVEAHAKIVKQDSERRRLQRVGAEIVRQANGGNLDRARELIDGGGVSLDYGE
jgi:replicative DNA helicase